MIGAVQPTDRSVRFSLEFTRRAMCLASLCVAAVPSAIGQMNMSAATLEDWFAAYGAVQSHETGTPEALATTEWIAATLAGFGYEVARQGVDITSTDITRASVRTEGASITGFRQEPAKLTSPEGVTGLLRTSPFDPCRAGPFIALVELDFARHSSLLAAETRGPVLEALRAKPAGMVIVTNGPSGEMTALNAPLEHSISSVPCLLVARRDAEPLRKAARRSNAAATLTLSGRTVRRRGENIIARRAGAGPALVISTPLSGWFSCAGERGSGVAAWLEIARRSALAFPGRELLFVGLTGHERENVGGKAFLDQLAPAPGDVALWCHIGSAFWARDWHETVLGLLPLPHADPQRFLLASDAYLATLRNAFRGVPGFEVPYEAQAEYAAGEAREILSRGYTNFIGNFGGHRLHHTRADIENCVDIGQLRDSTDRLHRAISAILT